MLTPFVSNPAFWAAVVAGILLIGLARRVPVIGTLFRLVLTAALVGAVVLAVGQRQRFDPYFAQATARLGLSGQSVDGKEVRVRMSPDGHFWVRATINGVEQRLLVDSGATVTALSAETAGRAGLTLRDEPFPLLLQTANGTITPQTATVGALKFGTVVARDLPVVVSPAFGDINVLGMNFLSRLKSWRVEDGYLIMTPHHPQGEAARAAPAAR